MPRPKEEAISEPAIAEAVVVRRTIEDHASDRGMAPGGKDRWKFEAARAYSRWPQGRELSAEEFDAAVSAAINSAIQ
jgi:hypothetical protein